MGLFSSKIRINVDVVTNPLIDKQDHQDFTKNAILRGTLGNQGVSNSLLEASLGGTAAVVDGYYKKHLNGSFLSTPKGQGFFDGVSSSEAKALIENTIGKAVTVHEQITSGPNAIASGLHYIQEVYGINLNTNEILNPIDEEDAEYFFVSAEFVFDDVDGQGKLVGDTILLTIQYTKILDGESSLHELQINNPYGSKNDIYLVAYYTLDSDETGKRYIFVKDISNNTNEVLNIGSFSRLDDYYPIVTIRKGKENTVDTAPQEKIEEINRALSHMNLTLEDITDGVMGGSAENDPEQMHDVFLMYAADLHSEDKHTIEYLYRYFKDLSYTQASSKAEFDNWFEDIYTRNRPKQTALRIVQDTFDVSLLFNYIDVRVVAGVLGNTSDVIRTFTVADPIKAPPFIFGFDFGIEETEMSTVVFRKQISETHYEEVTVHGLMHVHEVYDNHVAIRTIKNSLDEKATRDDDKAFFLPVSRNILRSMAGLKRHQVLQDTLCVTVYAVQKTKVRWYQRGIFKWVVMIVLVIVAFFTGQWQLPATWAAAGALAVSFLVDLVVGYIVGLILKPVLIEILQAIGVDSGFFVMVLAVIAAMFYQVDLVSIVADVALSTVDVAFALAGAFQEVIGQELLGIQTEIDSLLNGMDAFEKEMDAINDLLGYTSFDYYAITEQNRIRLEQPNEFFARTLNKNPGILALDQVTYFVQSKLQLPKYNTV